MPSPAHVVAVALDHSHRFSKGPVDDITLLEGLGVRGDAHAGVTVQHRSRVAADPTQPNLRQVHLIHAELHDELATMGYDVGPGQLGENVTTQGIDLIALPRGTTLVFSSGAAIEVTGLRNPCRQIDDFLPGLLHAVVSRDDQGVLRRRAGVMGVVVASGVVRPGDPITVELPTGPHHDLDRV